MSRLSLTVPVRISFHPVKVGNAYPLALTDACVTMGLPLAIFDRDITPNPDGLEKRDYGQAAIRSDGLRGLDFE